MKIELELEIDDELVVDFYEAVGAYPDPLWTEKQAQEWLANEHLLPFVEKSIIQAGEYKRRTRVTDAAMQEVVAREEAIRGRLARKAARASAPAA